MRIGVDIRCLMEENYSGISEYTYNLLNNIFKTDNKNQYILFYNSSKKPKLPDFIYPNVNFKGFSFPNKLFNLSIKLLGLFKVDKLIGGVDVFLMPNFLFINLSKGCKKIVVVHDLSFELYPEFFTFKKRLWHKLIGPKKLCQQAEVVIAISENTKRDLINVYGINENKIKVIYQGIADMYFNDIKPEKLEEVKQKYQLPLNYIFYLGNLEPRKNVEALLKAFEKIKDPDINLVLAGSKAWKYKNINQLYQNSSVKNRIKFLGYVEAQDKPSLYHLAKVFVYPSIYEGFGLPPVEAQASGAAVITSANSSLVEAVGDSAILIDANNYNELTNVLDNFLLDLDFQNKLVIAGKNNAQRFKWEKSVRQTLEILNSL